MKKPLQIVKIGGGERELLYTLSLYKILQDRNQQVVISKEATWADVTRAFLKMMYAAYLNAIEVRQIDDTAYNPERLKVMDFIIWSEEQPEEFAEQLKICYLFVTGKELDVKKKSIQEPPQKRRTSIWSRIGMIFRPSSLER